MRRSVFVTVLLASAVLSGPVGFSEDRQAPEKTWPPAHRHSRAAPAVPDVVSGCASGAPLAKVLIDLRLQGDRCEAEVTPASVCVAPGAVVRFKIENGCASLGDEARPLLEIGQPRPKPHLARRAGSAPESKGPEVFQNCPLRVRHLDKAESLVMHCDIPEGAIEGFYKYSLTGQIVTLDPDVEVHQ